MFEQRWYKTIEYITGKVERSCADNFNESLLKTKQLWAEHIYDVIVFDQSWMS